MSDVERDAILDKGAAIYLGNGSVDMAAPVQVQIEAGLPINLAADYLRRIADKIESTALAKQSALLGSGEYHAVYIPA